VSLRQVWISTQRLEKEGIISVERRKVAADYNEVNTYTLNADLFPSGGSANDCSPPKGESINRYKNTYTYPPSSQPKAQESECNSSFKEGTPNSGRSRKQTQESLDEATCIRLARSAVRRIDENARIPLTIEEVWEAAEGLKREHISNFNPGIWRAAKQKHGTRAALAVFLTVLEDQARRIDGQYGAAGYLYGVIAPKLEETFPEKNLC